MKNNINEIKRMQQLAGIITEANADKAVPDDSTDMMIKQAGLDKLGVNVVKDPTKKKTFQIQNIEKDLADRISDFKSIDTKNEISALTDMVISKVIEYHPEVQNTGALKQALYKIYQDYSRTKPKD